MLHKWGDSGKAMAHRRPEWERAGLQEARIIPIAHTQESTPVAVRTEPEKTFDHDLFYVLDADEGWRFIWRFHRQETNEILPIVLPGHSTEWYLIAKSLCHALWDAVSVSPRGIPKEQWSEKVTVGDTEYTIGRNGAMMVISRFDRMVAGMPRNTDRLSNDELCRVSHKLMDVWAWRNSNDAA